MALPLEGIKILDLSTMLPGPFCSMILADFGAEVIKVEAVKGGDLFRGGVPKIGDTGGAFFQVNRNKKSISSRPAAASLSIFRSCAMFCT